MQIIKRKPALMALAAIIILSIALGSFGYAISNGVPDGDNHPYVVLVLADFNGTPAWRGSGSLIAPNIVLTAGHVTDGASAIRIYLDANVTGNPDYPYGGPSAIEGTPYTHPEYSVGGSPTLPDWLSHDVGIVVLDESVYLDEYAELPAEGLVDTLAMKTWVDQVGYGVQNLIVGDYGRPYWDNPKVRMYAPAELITSNHKWSDEFIKTTANSAQGKGGTCLGDSGGPVLLGGTDTIIGVTSWGVDYNCRSVAYSSRVDTSDVLDWIYSFLK